MSNALRHFVAATLGALIGSVAGLLGVGGGEHRLPVLLGYIGLPLRQALGANLAIGLMTLSVSLARRMPTLDSDGLRGAAPLLGALLIGNLAGAIFGARTTARMKSTGLSIAARLFLLLMGVLFIYEALFHFPHVGLSPSWISWSVALVLGVGIGWTSGALGVAGGELRIPLLVFLFDVPIKLAGTMSIIVSIPGVFAALLRHARDGVPRRTWPWFASLGLGSIGGAVFGVAVLPKLSEQWLRVLLGSVLVLAGVCLHPRADVAAPQQ